MFYPSRQILGDQLAVKLEDYRNNDTIIFCLKLSSLLSCIELASRLHAYIYILQYSEVDDPYNITRQLGAIKTDGGFVLNPDITKNEYEFICSNFMGLVEQRKQTAFSKVNSENLNPNFDLKVFNNRNIIIFADILRTTFQLQVAMDVLKSYSPTKVYGAFGNITTSVSDKMQLETDGLAYMDILPHVLFDDDHYFDQPDKYSDEQKIKIANNISLYWA